ncbi:MAG: preprotein translocase subunit YajC [Frankia sp.]
MGAIAVADVAAGKSGSGGFGIVIWILLIGGVIAFMLSSRRRQRVAQQQRQAVLEPGSHVITTAGLHGTVVETDGGDVLLEVAPDVVLRFTRAAIARVVPPEETPGADTQGDGEDVDSHDAIHDAIHDAAMGRFADPEAPEVSAGDLNGSGVANHNGTAPANQNGTAPGNHNGAGPREADPAVHGESDDADDAGSGGSSAPKKL